MVDLRVKKASDIFGNTSLFLKSARMGEYFELFFIIAVVDTVHKQYEHFQKIPPIFQSSNMCVASFSLDRFNITMVRQTADYPIPFGIVIENNRLCIRMSFYMFLNSGK